MKQLCADPKGTLAFAIALKLQTPYDEWQTMNGRSCTVQRSLARFYLHRSDMTSLSSQISNLRQAIASTEESWDDSQAIEAINTQFATWDDLVAYADDNRGTTKLEEEVEKCRRIQAESEAEVSMSREL
jgi:hypothetical protein